MQACAGIFSHIQAYYDIKKHIQELFRDIEAHSEACVMP